MSDETVNPGVTGEWADEFGPYLTEARKDPVFDAAYRRGADPSCGCIDWDGPGWCPACERSESLAAADPADLVEQWDDR